jgi:hypothetical protein
MLALFAARLETPSGPMVGSVLAIAAGTALAAYGEVAFDTVGVAIMFVSAVSESLRLVMTQYLLVGLKMGPIEGLMYLGPACFVWLSLGAALAEWPAIAATGALGLPARHWGLFLVAACMGFLINVLAFATIKLASSLTLKVRGGARFWRARGAVPLAGGWALCRSQLASCEAAAGRAAVLGRLGPHRRRLGHSNGGPAARPTAFARAGCCLNGRIDTEAAERARPRRRAKPQEASPNVMPAQYTVPLLPTRPPHDTSPAAARIPITIDKTPRSSLYTPQVLDIHTLSPPNSTPWPPGPPKQVLGTVKNALLIVAAMAIYGEVVTGLQAVGYLLSSAAFAVFTYVKFQQVAAGG